MEALVNVITSVPVTVKAEVPVTPSAPLWVSAPLELTVRLPPRVEAAKSVAVLSVNCTAPVPEFNVIAPVKALEALVNVSTSVPVTVKAEVPVTISALV